MEPFEANPVLGAVVVDEEAPSANHFNNKRTVPATTCAGSQSVVTCGCASFVCGVLLGAVITGVASQFYLDLPSSRPSEDGNDMPGRDRAPAVHGGDSPSTAAASCSTISECVHGTCVMLEGAPACFCDSGWGGHRCARELDVAAGSVVGPESSLVSARDCSSTDCVHGTCAAFEGAAHCFCQPNWGGPLCSQAQPAVVAALTCDDISECVHGLCAVLEGAPACFCSDGWAGVRCDMELQYNDQPALVLTPLAAQGGEDSAVILNCDGISCGHGVCAELGGFASCFCTAGWHGSHCEQPIEADDEPEAKDCDDITCVHGSCAIHHDGLAACTCNAGYHGPRCEDVITGALTCADISDCAHGHCEVMENVPYCECDDGYLGPRCEEQAHHCLDAPRCLALQPPAGMTVEYSDDLFASSIATYSCSTNGTNPTLGDTERVCLRDGSWMGSAPQHCVQPESEALEQLADYVDGSISCGESVTGSTSGAGSHVGNSAGDHIYSFTLDEDQAVEFDTCDSSFDTWVRVYTADLVTEVAGCDDCGPCGSRSVLVAVLAAGDYVVVVDGYSSSAGSYEMQMSCETAAEVSGSSTVVHGGYNYTTIMPIPSAYHDGTVCHSSSLWLPIPGGYEMAPDTSDIVQNVVAAHPWSTHVMVLGSLRAYGTQQFRTGQEFGDHQEKAVSRIHNGEEQWSCPWTCYQILVRTQTDPNAPPPPPPPPPPPDPCYGDGIQMGEGNIDNDNGYSNGMSCRWAISCSDGTVPTISFNNFNTESGWDYVYIYDGDSTSDDRLGSYSGSSTPADVYASGSEMLIRFTTDGSVTRSNGPFNADITCGPPPPPAPPPPPECLSGETIEVGMSVQVRPSVATPNYGWGAVQHGDCGTVTSTGSGRVYVDFPSQSGWAASSDEMEPCGGCPDSAGRRVLSVSAYRAQDLSGELENDVDNDREQLNHSS
jgi:hypothetical protein